MSEYSELRFCFPYFRRICVYEFPFSHSRTCTNCPKKDFVPKCRSRSSSANEASKPVYFGRKWPSSGGRKIYISDSFNYADKPIIGKLSELVRFFIDENLSFSKSQSHQEHSSITSPNSAGHSGKTINLFILAIFLLE